jgi:hypothetical protein
MPWSGASSPHHKRPSAPIFRLPTPGPGFFHRSMAPLPPFPINRVLSLQHWICEEYVWKTYCHRGVVRDMPGDWCATPALDFSWDSV